MDSAVECNDLEKLKMPGLSLPYAYVDQNAGWCQYDCNSMGSAMLRGYPLGPGYVDEKILDSNQWSNDSGIVGFDLSRGGFDDDIPNTKKNKDTVNEVYEVVNESDVDLRVSENVRRNVLIKIRGGPEIDNIRNSVKRVLKEVGNLQVLFNLDTGNLLAIYYDTRSSSSVHEFLNAEQYDGYKVDAKFVDIMSPGVCFKIYRKYYDGDEGLDYDDNTGNPINRGKIQISGLQSEVYPVIESIINMFGRTLSVKKIKLVESFGMEVEYCDIRNAQAAYDSLGGCEYEEGYIKVTFCSDPISENTIASPKSKHNLVVPPIPKVENITSLVEMVKDIPASSNNDTPRHKVYSPKTSFSSVAARTLPSNRRTQCIIATPESVTISKPLKDTLSTSSNTLPIPPQVTSTESKKFSNLGNELNLEDIESGADKRTTFMIRNIPNKYTQCMLISFLNNTHKGLYDFLYLRMDFKNRCNVGYAFINFSNREAIISFVKRMMGRKWDIFNSDKVCSLSYANIQGKRALINRFRNSSVMLKDPSYRPKVFYTSGSVAGEEAPFPGPSISPKRKSNNFGSSKKNNEHNANNS